jgi:hypothetical protein
MRKKMPLGNECRQKMNGTIHPLPPPRLREAASDAYAKASAAACEARPAGDMIYDLRLRGAYNVFLLIKLYQ